MSVVVAVDLTPEDLDVFRPFRSRPDEAHVASQHVDELGKFVERRPTQEHSEAGSTVVALDTSGTYVEADGVVAHIGLRVNQPHGSKLEHLEAAAVATNPELAEEDRPPQGQPDRQGDAGDDRQGEEENRESDQTVDDVLDLDAGRRRRALMDRYEGNTTEKVDRRVVRHPLEEAGNDGDAHVAVGAFLDHAKHHLVRSRREREDHMLDAVRFDDFAKVPTRTEHRERGHPLSSVDKLKRILVEKANRFEADLAMLDQPFRKDLPDRACADDQRGSRCDP